MTHPVIAKTIIDYLGPAEEAGDPTSVRIYRDVLASCYLSTYKAIHLGGEETPESRMMRFAVTVCPTHNKAEMDQRIDPYDRISTRFKRMDDEQFLKFMDTATPAHPEKPVFFGKVDDSSVFIKKIPLCALEQNHPNSTANHFQLPQHYHYGVGSMGFGAWRELAAHEMTTRWVLNGECHNFPLMYHSRIIKRNGPPPLPVDRQFEIEDWKSSPAIAARLKSADTAPADLFIVMEQFPQTLGEWLHTQENLTEPKIAKFEQEINKVVAFMRSRGFLHFDAHTSNVLANDDHAYFADFGLAISREFDLSSQEEAFFREHCDYDRSFVAWDLVYSTLHAALGDKAGEAAWAVYLKTGKIAAEVPPPIASLAARYRPIVVLIDQFLESLRKVKSTPYPEAELALEWAKQAPTK